MSMYWNGSSAAARLPRPAGCRPSRRLVEPAWRRHDQRRWGWLPAARRRPGRPAARPGRPGRRRSRASRASTGCSWIEISPPRDASHSPRWAATPARIAASSERPDLERDPRERRRSGGRGLRALASSPPATAPTTSDEPAGPTPPPTSASHVSASLIHGIVRRSDLSEVAQNEHCAGRGRPRTERHVPWYDIAPRWRAVETHRTHGRAGGQIAARERRQKRRGAGHRDRSMPAPQ